MRVGERQRVHDELAGRIGTCTLCAGMNIKGKTQSAPGFGSVRSPVVVVGQSLCGPCMAKQEPFYGGTGALLNRAFADAGRRKADLYITNVVHCHPPRNRPSLPSEIDNCKPYLAEELAIVKPRLIIGLGEDARGVLDMAYPEARRLDWPLVSVAGMTPPSADEPDLLFPTHPGAFRWKPTELRAELTEQFVDCLARAVRWGFELPPTCDGMADGPQPLREPKG